MLTKVQRIDPSRTTMLRKKFSGEFLKRLNQLKGKINKLIVEEDALGLGKEFVENTRWAFRTDSEKLNLFGSWLSSEISSSLFPVSASAIDESIWYRYIWQGYQKGIARSFADTSRIAQFNPTTAELFTGGRAEFLRQSFSHPVSVDRVKTLAGRVLTDLKGVTETMEAQMKRELLDGLTQGLSPREVARNLNNRVDKIGKVRAKAIAQTETIRAHAEGQLDGLERLGVDEIGVMAEWTTSGLGITELGNPSPCKLCSPLDGVVLTVKESRGLIPRHPNCKCTFKPANVGEPKVGKEKKFFDFKSGKVITRKQRQQRTQAQIKKSLDQSIRSEGKKSLKEAKEKSSWVGSDVKVSKKRPKGILE